ncbi:hypothetical protein GCM10009792_23530 [Microcella alkalica]
MCTLGSSLGESNMTGHSTPLAYPTSLYRFESTKPRVSRYAGGAVRRAPNLRRANSPPPIGRARARNCPESLLVEARSMAKRQLLLFLGFALLVFAGAALLGFAVDGGV